MTPDVISDPAERAFSATNGDVLGSVTGVLAVVAHPDDESFGLGAVLSELIGRGARAGLICFTHGEASSLHGTPGELSVVRSQELKAAAAELGLSRVESHGYPDGHLDTVPVDELAGHVVRMIGEVRPSHLLVFDSDGVTGHPDHRHATGAALRAARATDLPVLVWTLPRAVAQQLNTEFGTRFTGHDAAAMDIILTVSRRQQVRAIACHRSQSYDNPVLHRRLQLLGDQEYLLMSRQ